MRGVRADDHDGSGPARLVQIQDRVYGKMPPHGIEERPHSVILTKPPTYSEESHVTCAAEDRIDRGLPVEGLGDSTLSKPEGPIAKPRSLQDYGWRLHGRPVTVLKDHSFTLQTTRQRAVIALLSPYCADGTSLMSCLQCGMCTASCNLAEQGSLFPRRQMALLQLGQKESLVADPNIWLCFNCTDCSSHCPANARPERIMAAIRQMAVEHYSPLRFLCRVLNRPKGLLFVFLVPTLLLLVALAIGGSFTPQLSPVHYATMFPHLTLELFFLTATSFGAVSVFICATRAWKAFAGEPLWRADLRHLFPAVYAAIREALAHRKFSECEQFPLSRWAHACLFYGFLTLFTVSGLVVVLTRFGVRYPFPVLHPLKIIGNLAGALLILGSTYFVLQRRRASRNGDASSWFDWVLLLDLLLVGATGMLTEVFRCADIAMLAYPTYFVHLVSAFVLLVGLPYSKFSHVVYRTLALTVQRYERLTALALTQLENRRATA
jgi:quinone-modifying oxidoreductase subunit QmoC